MALSSVTTTFNLHDLFGDDFDPRRTKAWATTNVDSIHDTSTGETRVGGAYVTIAADGTGSFTHWAPGADGNPISWQTTYHFDAPDRTQPKGRRTESYGPFTVTTSGLLTALVEEQEVPPTYLSTVTTALDTYVTAAELAETNAEAAQAAAEAARDGAVAIAGPVDATVEALVKNTGGVGPLTSAALAAEFAPVAKNLRHPLTGMYHVEGFGAVGDWNGTTGTNDAAAIQSAIDAAFAAGGGVVYISKAHLVGGAVGLTLRAGVSLTGPVSARPRYVTSSHPAQLVSTTAGAIVVDTETVAGNTRISGMGVSNIYVHGTGVASIGIRFHKTWWSTIRAVTAKDFVDQGILLQQGVRGDGTPYNVAATVQDVLTVNCVINTVGRSALIGSVEIQGSDHHVDWIEAATPLISSVSDSNLYCCGILIGAWTSFFTNLVGEFADVGIRVTGNYSVFSNCRADTNPGHGWWISGIQNTFSACSQLTNSQAGAGVYSGFKVTGASNAFSGCIGKGTMVKYHIEDLATGPLASDRNTYDPSCTGAYTTAMHYSAPYLGSGRRMAPHDLHPAAGTTSIDVTGAEYVVLDNYTAATSITALTGGTPGQEVTILASPSTVPITLVHATTFRQRTGANQIIFGGEQVTFKLMGGNWYEMAAGARLRAANMTTVDVAFDLMTEILLCANSGSRTTTLPDAAQMRGRRRIVKSTTGTAAVTVASAGGTVTPTTVYPGGCVEYVSNGTNWYPVAVYAPTLTGTATLDFASIAAGAIGELTITVTGAVVGDTVTLGPPAAIEAGLNWSGFVSAADTVKIRLHNVTASAIDPVSASWKAAIVR